MIHPRSFAAWVLLVVLAGPVQAQDTTDVAFRVQMSDSVAVTASRVASTVQQTGRRVTVYTQRDIQLLSVNTVDQLLNVAAGVDVQSRGGFGVQSDLRMRGSTFNGVLLLLDGARLNDPMTGHFLMDLPVPLSEIARVEVLWGPATALYGPDALGGVVHLITKTALRSGRMVDTGLAAQIDGRYGENNLYDAGGAARHVGTTTAVSVAATLQSSDGQPIRTDGQPVTYRDGAPVRTDFRRRAGTSALAHNLGGATLYARVGVDDRDFGAWHYYTDFSSDKARESTSTFWTQVRAIGDRNASTKWRAQASAKQHRDRYLYNASATPSRHTSRMLNVQAQASRTVGAVRVTGGASGQLRGIDSNSYGLHSDVFGGAFVRLRWTATPRLTLNQSLRVDYDPLYGVEPTPQLYLAYSLGPATLRAGGGRAVRAPNYVERFIDSPVNKGNPTLDSEKAWSGELGLDLRPPGPVGLHLTGFARNTEDLIDYIRRDGVFQARNLNGATRGIEAEARAEWSLGEGQVCLRSSYTYLDPDFDVQPVADYKYATTSTQHLLQGSASIAAGGTTVGVQGLWKDRLIDDGPATGTYGVVHGRIGHTFQLGGQSATVSLEVRNLFDQEYTEIFDAPMPDRTLLVGAKVQL
jgi:iron complex outermembrane receptor protein